MLKDAPDLHRIVPERNYRLVLVCSPKGGQGKSMLARNLLVCAALNGVRAVGLDFDQQGTLQK
jgi:chromosome partitioning protein